MSSRPAVRVAARTAATRGRLAPATRTVAPPCRPAARRRSPAPTNTSSFAVSFGSFLSARTACSIVTESLCRIRCGDELEEVPSIDAFGSAISSSSCRRLQERVAV